MTPAARDFVRDYGLTHPFVSAGMGFVALPDLVVAVSQAGAFGLLGASPAPPPLVKQWIQEIRGRMDRPFGVDLIVDVTDFGPASTEEHIALLCDERVPVVAFHWNDPPTEWVERLQAAGTRVWRNVASVADAKVAVEAGFDAVVAQGAEAGGHNRSQIGLFTLLPSIVDAVAPVPVIAAGGIGEGRTAAAALALGASAVCVGTRLLASPEAHVHAGYRDRVVQAKSGDVARTRIFGPEWPDQPMVVLRNRAVRDAEEGKEVSEATIGRTSLFGQPYEMPRRSAMLPTPETEGDLEEMCLAAGESAALVTRTQPAAEIVEEMMAEVGRILAAD